MEKAVRKKKINTFLYAVLLFIALVYIAALLKLVLFKNGLTSDFREVQPIPFLFLMNLFSGMQSVSVFLKNVLGNIALFVPLGIFLQPLLRRKIGISKAILAGMSASIIIELIQFIIGCGITDIDDVILNTIGTVLGCLLGKATAFKIDKKYDSCIGSIILLAAIGLIGVFLLWYLGWGSGIIPASVEINNQEVLQNLDIDSYDDSIEAEKITDDAIIGLRLTYDADGRKVDNSKDESFKLAPDVKLYTETYSYDYSPNGNIRKTSIDYSEISKSKLSAVLEEKTCIANLWFDDDGSCKTVVVRIYND